MGSARQHYTERDILDLHARGEHVLAVTADDRLTDLARERAVALGVKIVIGSGSSKGDLTAQVRRAVRARLGDTVDGELIDRVIERVLTAIGKG